MMSTPKTAKPGCLGLDQGMNPFRFPIVPSSLKYDGKIHKILDFGILNINCWRNLTQLQLIPMPKNGQTSMAFSRQSRQELTCPMPLRRSAILKASET